MALEEADGALFAALRQQVSDPKCEAGGPKSAVIPRIFSTPLALPRARTHASSFREKRTPSSFCARMK